MFILFILPGTNNITRENGDCVLDAFVCYLAFDGNRVLGLNLIALFRKKRRDFSFFHVDKNLKLEKPRQISKCAGMRLKIGLYKFKI